MAGCGGHCRAVLEVGLWAPCVGCYWRNLRCRWRGRDRGEVGRRLICRCCFAVAGDRLLREKKTMLMALLFGRRWERKPKGKQPLLMGRLVWLADDGDRRGKKMPLRESLRC